jgi:glutamate-1-semialdehyde 2,1-aminomutase
MAVFAKAVSNGIPMAAIIGKESVMDAAQVSFISSTYWTDRTGPAAALATIGEIKERSVPDVVAEKGKAVHKMWREAAEKAGLSIEIEGPPALSHFSFLYDNEEALNTLMTQELLKQGILGKNSFYASAAHSQKALQAYEKALNIVFPKIKRAIENNAVLESLEGPIHHKGFTRLT